MPRRELIGRWRLALGAVLFLCLALMAAGARASASPTQEMSASAASSAAAPSMPMASDCMPCALCYVAPAPSAHTTAAALARYTRLAPRYEDTTTRIRDARERAIDLLALQPGETVFDIACGAGAILRGLSWRGTGGMAARSGGRDQRRRHRRRDVCLGAFGWPTSKLPLQRWTGACSSTSIPSGRCRVASARAWYLASASKTFCASRYRCRSSAFPCPSRRSLPTWNKARSSH